MTNTEIFHSAMLAWELSDFIYDNENWHFYREMVQKHAALIIAETM